MKYVVQPGDTMHSIALKFNVPLHVLITANPQVIHPSQLQVGEVLEVSTTYYPHHPHHPAGTTTQPTSPPAPVPTLAPVYIHHGVWCTLVLHQTESLPDPGPGSALVRMAEHGHVMVATMEMPHPKQYGAYDVYTAWMVSSMNPLTVRDYFDLAPAKLFGFWINHKNIQGLQRTDEILVNPEPEKHGPHPSNNLYVLRGSLAHCCPAPVMPTATAMPTGPAMG
ncbi:LysM peptidoglycan-binding domain-containing protein [Desulfotomaculum copahuensis]|uniref:LysM domain-containing protein n=1 Tax=Desulfotomaculum copahuensis TaxID=1838280 RepID=A0A1B7LDY2_9FIRM|nr:LysM domain-containing protein [Desulfotomaculum copahuensis]OAT81289.1 hypothetical protein A6M21_00390 [Desulfotomaculum copahuensis]